MTLKGTSRGFLYSATGERFVEEALESARSLKRHMPGAHVTLVTDFHLVDPAFDVILPVDSLKCLNWRDNLTTKINAFFMSQYDYTLFVDTDTYFCDDVSEVFDLLDHFDVLICHDYCEDSPVTFGSHQLKAFPGLNTGVIAYRKNQVVEQMLAMWRTLFLEDKENRYWSDQPVFMDALVRIPVRLNVLHSIYNFRVRQNIGIPSHLKVKILHGRCTPVQFAAYERLVNPKGLSQRAWVACTLLDWNSIRWHVGFLRFAIENLKAFCRSLFGQQSQERASSGSQEAMLSRQRG